MPVFPCVQQMPGQDVSETPTTTSDFTLFNTWGPVLTLGESVLCWLQQEEGVMHILGLWQGSDLPATA